MDLDAKRLPKGSQHRCQKSLAINAKTGNEELMKTKKSHVFSA